MSLTTKKMTDIIRKCKFYGDIHQYNKYINQFVMNPIKTYDKHPCRKLEAIRLTTTLRKPQDFLDRVYTYKTIRNIDLENFTPNTHSHTNKYIAIIVFLVILVFLIKYK